MDKKRLHDDISYSYIDCAKTLPAHCRRTVRTHINTVYVGSIMGIYDRKYGPKGQLATAHLSLNDQVYITLHEHI